MNDEMSRALYGQMQIYEEAKYHENMGILIEQREYNLFSILKPKLSKDGNQWCVLYGDDLQSGVAGFGDTPYLAILDWNKKWNEK